MLCSLESRIGNFNRAPNAAGWYMQDILTIVPIVVHVQLVTERCQSSE